MYTVAICDDENIITTTLQQLILEWNPTLQVTCVTSGEELLQAYHPYDAIFLDIDMKGINGIETGRRIRQMDKETKIIYLTAYRDYVAGAFEVHAFQYLLKPIKKKILWDTLEELFRYIQLPEKKVVMDFHTVNGMVCLAIDQIYYFEYINRRIKIVEEAKEHFMVDKISSVLVRMQEFGFSMPHQSFVVNMLHVKNIKNQQIYLDNGMLVPIAQKKQKSWKQELTTYLSKRLETQKGRSYANR
ncbi:MAG: response regulator transcription factor [Candidatus Galacturonibacter soehngenii]|nr:response regulator transcription factor [Candidatus Galacturonibacter soehngenii]